jgi:hypothetical protein
VCPLSRRPPFGAIVTPMFPRSDALLLSLILLVPAMVGLLALRDVISAVISMIVAALGGV